MKGIQHIEVSNRDAKFKFDLHRNITVVQGDSGTGKTTLYDMIADYTRLKNESGVNISASKKCVALVDLDWKNQLGNTTDSIVFIDEGAEYIKSKKFASMIKDSDNYYVLFTRENLHELPYSVEEIYEIKTSGKYHRLVKRFKCSKGHRYAQAGRRKKVKFEVVVTEDSQSGYQFFENYFAQKDIVCETSKSNAQIFRWLIENRNRQTLVIADGAAFGSEINRILKLKENGIDFMLCLPESFEWLILKSGLIRDSEIDGILENPSAYIESSEYFSWENYFTEYLIKKTKGKPFQYTKKKINPVYLNAKNSQRIISVIFPE